MKRRWKWTGGIVLVVAAVGLFLWHPWHRVSLDEASFVFPGAPGVTPPPELSDVMVVLYSGDGGWSDLDQGLGKALVDRGIPVYGVSSFKYFWRPQLPEVTGPELDDMLAEYLPKWHKKRVLLVGFSFGADVVPSILAQASPATRAAIAQIVLLSPSRDVNFEIEMEDYMVANWFTTKTRLFTEWVHPIPHYPAVPPLAALDGKPPVACYYGKEQLLESLCTATDLPRWVGVHPMPGTHHFDANYPALATRMVNDFPH
jgi:type IV secretory pathway VirJ component